MLNTKAIMESEQITHIYIIFFTTLLFLLYFLIILHTRFYVITTIDNNDDPDEYDPDDYEIEEFQNTTLIPYTHSKQLHLLPVDDDILLSGHGLLYYSDTHLRLDLYCNLYVLNGNIFEQPFSNKHEYQVYLLNSKINKQTTIGSLKKDGDGIYKLTYTSTQPNLFLQNTELRIAYNSDNRSTDILKVAISH